MTKTKKVLSIILAILMIATTIPFTPVASAAETPAHIYDEADLIAALENGGNYVLNDNITVTEEELWVQDAKITIDLNGFTIKSAEYLDECILIMEYAISLTLKGGTLEQIRLYVNGKSTFQLENMDIFFNLDSWVVSSNGESTVIIKNTNIEGHLDDNRGQIVIYSGSFTENVSAYLHKIAVQTEYDGKYFVTYGYSSYTVTLAYKVHNKQLSKIGEYTGPDCLDYAMGVTVHYYEGEFIFSKDYAVVDLSSSDEGEMLYVDIEVPEPPVKIEYYCKGMAVPNEWSLYSVTVNDMLVWEGEIRAKGAGSTSPHIAKLDLSDGTITKISGAEDNPIASSWVKRETTNSSWEVPFHVKKIKMLSDKAEYEYIIDNEPVYHDVAYYMLNSYDVVLNDELIDKPIDVVIICSESVQGIEVIGDDVNSVSYDSDNKQITVSNYQRSNLFNSFTLKISDPEWNEQQLKFKIKETYTLSYADVFCTVNLIPIKTFTLDAAGGIFEKTEDLSSTVQIKNVCNTIIGGFPIPYKKGYSFKGFYLTEDTDHNDDVVPESEKLTGYTVMTENKTWYASWAPRSYTVSYSYLNENGESEIAEISCKYGKEYSALEIPAVFNVGDVIYTFTGWSPEFTGTKIMDAENVFYEAQYTTSPNYADYTKLYEAVVKAEELIRDKEYVARYTEEARLEFEALLEEDIERDLLASDQAVIDERINTINNTIATMEKNKHSVVFVDIDGEEILSVEAEYGSKVNVPVISSFKVCDESDHYVFSDWDKSTDGCEYVTRDMQFNAIYNKEAHSFTHYTVVSSSESTGRTLISYCDDGCGAKDILNIIGSCAEHEDKDNDDICDICSEEIEVIAPDEPAEDTCDRCGEVHTDFFRNFICMLKDFFNRIINFFTGLFK